MIGKLVPFYFLLLPGFFIHGSLFGQQLSPVQDRVATGATNAVYDTRAWAFDAGAPVRATPLVRDGLVYFGTAAGDFIAIDQSTSREKWRVHTGSAIHSTAIANKKLVFFSDNRQSVYALAKATGKQLWKFDMGPKIDYPWRFDYFYSSPVLDNDDLFIGGDDGYLYRLSQGSGKLIWKFRARGLVRSTPVLFKNAVLFGDTEAAFYSLDIKSGRKIWEFRISGDSIDNSKYGYDKRAITSSPVTAGDKVLFGARDADLYCLDADSGRFNWKISHEPSWIISTVAIKDSFVVTGTSDGRFVQALNLQDGHEIWKHHTAQAVWASPLIQGNKVYTGGFDGQLLCLDLLTGERISGFCTNAIIFSSPVISQGRLYFGSDDGHLYALKARKLNNLAVKREGYVYYDTSMPVYFRGSSETRVRNFLFNNEFQVIGIDTLASLLASDSPGKKVVVADGFNFPKAIRLGNEQSILRKYLDGGGRLVLIGNNPLFYEMDEKTNDIGLSITQADSLLGLHFGPNDTRAFGGLFPSFPTEKGKEMGLPDSWVSNFGIDPAAVDILLGKNENGQASAYVKKYRNGGALVQIWINDLLPVNLDAIIKVSENAW